MKIIKKLNSYLYCKLILPMKLKIGKYKWERMKKITSDGIVELPRIEFYIVNGCNLKCEYCCHFNPFRKGFVPLNELQKWFQTWSPKLRPNHIQLLGGEPFLHPNIIEVVTAAKEYWKSSDIRLTTNGLLLQKISEDKLNAFSKLKIRIDISMHESDEISLKRSNIIQKRLKNAKVRFILKPSNLDWIPMHQLDEEGHPKPFKNPPLEAYNMCSPKNCIPILNNRLFRCSILANVHSAYSEGVLSDEWKKAAASQSLQSNVTPREILDFIKSPLPECSICPVKLGRIQSKQLASTKK